MVLICDGKAILLTSDDGVSTKSTGIPELRSSQEESDTRIILYCKYAESKGYQCVKIRSPDSDVFWILLHYAHTFENTALLLESGTEDKQRLLDVTSFAKKYSPEFCSVLLSLHAFSGCDTTSAFRGIGKIKPLKVLQKSPQFVTALAQVR